MNPQRISLLALAVAVLGIASLSAVGHLIATVPALIAFQLLAVCLMIWARVAFGRRSFHAGANPTEGGLVTTGPYRYLRHPIYAAATYIVWGGALSEPTLTAAGLALVVTLCLLVRALLEERLVRVAYPEYDEYAARTKRLIPFLL